MELKLVYRFLRQVSDWVLDNYYSEVVVEGAENVPLHGPVIMCVHNPFSESRPLMIEGVELQPILMR